MTETLFLTFQSQLSVVMETVLKSAMFEITRLVEDSFLEEVGHHKQEVEVLKLRLQLSESKLREREWERERERGRRTRCPDCGRTGDSNSREENQAVETVRGADALCLGISLREQSTNPPALNEEVWSTRQHLESNKQTTTTTNTHPKEKNDAHRPKPKEIITPNDAQVPQDFLQRLLSSSVIQSESTSDFKPRDQSEKDFTLDKEMDSNHSGLLQSPSAQDAHKDLPTSPPNGRVKSEIPLDLLPVKEEEEMVPVWDSDNRDDGGHAEMADPSQAELRGSCDQEEIQIGRSVAEHPSTEQGYSQPINKQRTFSVVAREILTQFQVWQKASYSRNIDWSPITAKIISKLPQFYGREAELIVRCTKMLHNRRDYLRRRAKESAVERNLLPMGQRYLIHLQRDDVQNVKL